VLYFGRFFQNVFVLKSNENYLRKTCTALVPKMLEELTHVVNFCAKAKRLLCRLFLMILMADRLFQKA
jgi:hypothetical protein